MSDKLVSLTYTTQELSKLLGLNRKSIYEAAARGEIPCLRVGRRILWPKAAIEAWLAESAQKPTNEPVLPAESRRQYALRKRY